MTLEQLGAIGEFVGAIAVIASVLYLAVQIRHGVRSSEGAAVQNVTSLFARMQFDLARDPELWTLMERAHRGEALTNVERGRAGDLLAAYFIAFENFHYQHLAGLMGPTAFRARERVIANILSSPFAREWWAEYGRDTHPEAFVVEVDRILAGADAAG
jgi:hypothetical protein